MHLEELTQVHSYEGWKTRVWFPHSHHSPKWVWFHWGLWYYSLLHWCTFEGNHSHSFFKWKPSPASSSRLWNTWIVCGFLGWLAPLGDVSTPSKDLTEECCSVTWLQWSMALCTIRLESNVMKLSTTGLADANKQASATGRERLEQGTPVAPGWWTLGKVAGCQAIGKMCLQSLLAMVRNYCSVLIKCSCS